MKKFALASRMGQIADPDYMGAKKTLTPNPENWIKLSGLFRNHVGPDSSKYHCQPQCRLLRRRPNSWGPRTT